MSRYIVQRLFVALPALLAVTVVTVGLRELSSDEELISFALEGGDVFGDEGMAELRAYLGIGQSFPERYVQWLGGALRGDLGTSWWAGREVSTTIASRLMVSAPLALMAITVASLTAIMLGGASAIGRGRPYDYVARAVSVVGRSVPDFLLASLVFHGLSFAIGGRPDFIGGWWADPALSLAALALGALVVGCVSGAIGAYLIRPALFEVLQRDYVRTAQAKGLTERALLVRQALPNALPAVLGIVAVQLSAVLGSLVVIEIVFGLPGVGTLIFEAVLLRDYPVVQGVLFVSAVTVIGVNLAVDVACAALDPRIRDATRDTRGDARPDYAL